MLGRRAGVALLGLALLASCGLLGCKQSAPDGVPPGVAAGGEGSVAPGDGPQGKGHDYQIVGVAVTASLYAANEIYCSQSACSFVGHGYHVLAHCEKTCDAYLKHFSATVHYDEVARTATFHIRDVAIEGCEGVLEPPEAEYVLETKTVLGLWNGYFGDTFWADRAMTENGYNIAGEHYEAAYGVSKHAGWMQFPVGRCLEDETDVALVPFYTVVDSEPPSVPSPQAVLRGAVVADIATSHGCAVHESGSVVCWVAAGAKPGPPVAVEGIEEAVDVRVGNGRACAVLTSGQVACWNLLTFPELSAETELPSIDAAVRLIEVGSTTCALNQDGGVSCATADKAGESWSHVGGATNVVGSKATGCALSSSGDISCWGTLVADVSPPSVGLPVVVLSNIKQLEAMPGGVCALDTAGAARCWGSFNRGQPPIEVEGIGTVAQLGTACALTEDEAIQCWKHENGGFTVTAIGDVDGPTKLGSRHALRSNGEIWAWGRFVEPEPVPMLLGGDL